VADAPRVTVGFATYNVERYLPQAFEAVLAQDFPDFEVVICDNQSTDATWEICQRYAEKDDRFRIYRNENNLGYSGNVRRLVSLARGEFFRLTGHDDLIAPTFLRRCLEALDANPHAVLAFPLGITIDDDGNRTGASPGERALNDSNPCRRIVHMVQVWAHCNEVYGLIRADVLRRTGLIGTYISSDRRLLVELAARGEFELVPEPLFYRRVHRASTFGEERAGRVFDWLEPQLAATRRPPARHMRSRGDFGHLTIDTIRALLRSELPRPWRLATAAAFAGFFTYRRARIRVGRIRRQIRHGHFTSSSASRPVAR
jgi:glycosyltransferase involved in cell wall biosynthesis